ncbi:hypothetical protein COCVIDRAFT_103008, partial [Bipolaris victoriae FI3]
NNLTDCRILYYLWPLNTATTRISRRKYLLDPLHTFIPSTTTLNITANLN